MTDLDALRQRLFARSNNPRYKHGVDATLAALEQVGWWDGVVGNRVHNNPARTHVHAGDFNPRPCYRCAPVYRIKPDPEGEA